MRDDVRVRVDLPGGVVSFLFTDVVGSTRLLEELGAEGYAVVNDAHRVVIRRAVAEHGGTEVSTHGDAFFCVFSSPVAAVGAAVAAQAGLAGGPIGVRIGIHVGEAVVADRTYVGMDVNRAARIMDAGHAGQVLVSEPVRALLPDEVAVVDLGEHRLKDLAAPVRLFQVGEGSFGRLRSLPSTNLPVPATPFLGRERELADVAALLVEGGPRVVSLTGPGGTGKTRLALQAAAEVSDAFPDGVFWVGLSALRDPAHVLPAIAASVGLEHDDEATLADALAAHLATRKVLLLLDNAEQLLPALAPIVAGLVADSPGTKVLVTSRERLQITAETAYPVPELTHEDAVQLFRARARASGGDPGDPTVVDELCDRLERLPLALELAAARTTILSPAQLLDRLGQRLDLLKGHRDTDPRQATLRATIDWSYDLLDAEEQRVFRGLSVFVGGCTFETAEDVLGADLDTLQSLLDKSLLRRRQGHAGDRLWMLETIREYSNECLRSSSDHAAVAAAHAAWVHALVERAAPELIGSSQLDWLGVLDDEIDNVRAAFLVLVGLRKADEAADVALDIAFYLEWRGLGLERLGMLQTVLELTDLPDLDQRRRCRMLMVIAFGASPDEDVRRSALEEAQPLADQLGDPQLRGRALEARATFLTDLSSEERVEAMRRARTFFEEAGEADDIARVALNLGAVLLDLGRPEEAVRASEDAAALARSLGNRHKEGLSLMNAADAMLLLGRPEAGASYLRQALRLLDELGDVRGLVFSVAVAAHVAAIAGDLRSAALLLGAHDGLLPAGMGDPIDEAQRVPARRAVAEGLGGDAARLLAEGAALDLGAAVTLAGVTLNRVAGEGGPPADASNLASRAEPTRP